MAHVDTSAGRHARIESKADDLSPEGENAALRRELAVLRGRLNASRQANIGAVSAVPRSRAVNQSKAANGDTEGGDVDESAHLSIVVLGASGDLSVKKTYPALFALFRHRLLPKRFTIVGYARSKFSEEEFRKKVSAKFGSKFPQQLKDEFLSHCWYERGQYDSKEDFEQLHMALRERELKNMGINAEQLEQKDAPKLNRIFYMALPPTAFVPAAKSIHAAAETKHGWNRVVIEKPFGRDSESSEQLGRELSNLFDESMMYRIDHYLGKEMVQNLMVLRFANRVFEPLWNRDHINCVQITFKEDFGTQGRGGYVRKHTKKPFDNFGIIRDVMQNHLLQILSIIGMEPPLSLSAEDVRDEKVKLLRSIAPITIYDTVVGQYTAEKKPGGEPGYLDEPDVPDDSVTPTYAVCVLHCQNTRWMGVPFILKCGKGLNEKKADIRIQFKTPVNTLFDDVSPNELVLRVGPDEVVYMKMTTKAPGLDSGNAHTELDLTYKKRFTEEMADMPDAYERLILDVIRGDHNLFVRADELAAAWRIFTPLLHTLENDRAKLPIKYEFGSRGPPEADQLIEQYGFVRTSKYRWEEQQEKAEKKLPSGSSHKEPQALTTYLAALTAPGSDRNAAQLLSCFSSDASVLLPSQGAKRASDFFDDWIRSTRDLRFSVKQRLTDSSAPNRSIALMLSVEGQGKETHDAMQLIQLNDDGSKINSITMINEIAKSKL